MTVKVIYYHANQTWNWIYLNYTHKSSYYEATKMNISLNSIKDREYYSLKI